MKKRLSIVFPAMFMGLVLAASVSFAQSTGFTYQGSLNNSGLPANGNYDFEFKLFDALTGGTQDGTPRQVLNVAVSNGTFTLTLDFGAGAFPGADRFLEIAVKPAGGAGFTTLTPRQQIAPTPFALKSSSADQASFAINAANATNAQNAVNAQTAQTATNATNATNATTAQNALQLGGVAANNFVQTNDARLTDARNPLPNSTNYIQNGNTPQPASRFNISGTGMANIFSAATQYNIGNDRVIGSIPFSFFAGIGAGTSNTTGIGNAFFGLTAGTDNTTGSNNSFFGISAGANNSTGSANSYFGTSAGGQSTTASNNSFFGTAAGSNNSTGSANSYFGTSAGTNSTTANNNSFFGAFSGLVNTTGNSNAFFGADAGRNNTIGGRNSFFGFSAGRSNTSGARNSFFGTEAGLNSTGQNNSFFGDRAGRLTTGGERNSFFGSGAGENNTGSDNVYIGNGAGSNNTTGSKNTAIGAGSNNTTGSNNTAIGAGSSVSGSNLNFATAIGAGSGVSSSNTINIGRTEDQVNVFGGLYALGNLTTSSDLAVQHSATIGNSLSPESLTVYGSIGFSVLGSGGQTTLCYNSTTNKIANCSSSLRYKTGIASFNFGLNLVNRLRPITFNWKDGGMRDLGLGAEDVAKAEPLLVTYNEKGEVEGVKYDRVAVVLLNAVNEQQEMIQKQQAQIDELKKTLSSIQQNKTVSKTSRNAKR